MSTLNIDNLSPVQAYQLAYHQFYYVKNSEFSKEDYKLLAEKVIASNNMPLILNWANTFPIFQEEMVDIICSKYSTSDDGKNIIKLLKRLSDENSIIKAKYKILELFTNIEELTQALHNANIEQSKNECLAKFYDGLPAEIQLGIKL